MCVYNTYTTLPDTDRELPQKRQSVERLGLADWRLLEWLAGLHK